MPGQSKRVPGRRVATEPLRAMATPRSTDEIAVAALERFTEEISQDGVVLEVVGDEDSLVTSIDDVVAAAEALRHP